MNIVYVVGDSINTHNARTQITYAAWMKWNGTSDDNAIEKNAESAGPRTYVLPLNRNDAAHARVRCVTHRVGQHPTGCISKGVWCHKCKHAMREKNEQRKG